jgi:hypothetical protein
VTEYDKVVPPGGSGKIVASISTGHGNGLMAKSIRVSSNSVENPEVSLTCKGFVTRAFEVGPPDRIMFNEVKYGDSREEKITLRATDGQSFEIKSVETNSEFVKAEAEPPKESGGAYTLKVKLLSTAPVGLMNNTIRVSTTHPKKPVVDIYYHADIKGPIDFMPKWIRIPSNQAGEKGEVTLSTTGDETFSVRKVDVPKGFSADLQQQEAGKRYLITVTMNTPLEQPSNFNLTVETDRPEQATITIPLSVMMYQKGAPVALPQKPPQEQKQ